jgi:hypothetical protein
MDQNCFPRAFRAATVKERYATCHLKNGLRVCALAALCWACGSPALQAQGLPDTLTVTSATPPPYQANLSISTSGTVTVNGSTTTTYTAGSQITLLPGFTAVASSGTTPTFIANIQQPPFYPDHGSGGSQTFVISASDPGGYQNITNIQITYNWNPTGVDGCMLSYDVVNDALSIGDLTGSLSTFGTMSLRSPPPSGMLGDNINSNCEIAGNGSSIAASGNNINLTLNTHFRAPTGSGDPTTNPPGVPGFIGQQNIYMVTTTADQQQPGPTQLVGTWTAYPVPQPGSYSSVIAPGSVNPDGTITLQMYDPNGYDYQPYMQAVFGTSLTDPNACRILYSRGTGAANHVLSLYAGAFTQPGMIGTAPVGTPGAIVQDTATCILDISHSYVVQETGTAAIVNLALTFKNAGTINTYAQGFDRQNAGGALLQSSITTGNSFSLSPVSAVSVQQSGTPAAFTLNVPATGTFSGPVTFTYTAPAGVTLSFQNNPLTVPAAASTTVQVMASATATVGSGAISITGTSGSLTYLLNIPVTVAAATTTPPATFALSGPQINSSAQQATFTVALTGLNGFSQTQQVLLSVDAYSDDIVSASLSATSSDVPGSFTATVGIAAGVAPGTYGGAQCAIIDATTGTGAAVQQVELCVNAASNTNFSVPQLSQSITIPSGGSTTIYGSINNSSSPSFSQSVSCPAGVSPCDASATFGTPSNGVVPLTLNTGSLQPGITYTQTMTASGISQGFLVTVTGTALLRTINDAASPFTYNDGVQRQFPYHCVNCQSAYDVASCSASDSTVQTTISRVSTGSPNFYINFTAPANATIGTDNVSCHFYAGTSASAGTLTVLSTSSEPTITSVCSSLSVNPTDPNCAAPLLLPGANAITINGANLTGPNPDAAPTLHFGVAGAGASPLSGSPLDWQSSRIDASINVLANTTPGQYYFYVFPLGFGGFNSEAQPQSNQAAVGVSSCVNPSVKITSRPITITSTGGTPPMSYAYTATLTSAVSAAGGSYTWTTDNPQMVTFITPATGPGASQVTIGIWQTNASASITLTYTFPCGGSLQDTFRFALSNDTTAVAWVDASPSQVQVPSTASVYAANPSSSIPSDLNGPQCLVTLQSWSAGAEIGLGSGTNGLVPQEVAYANAWLVANSGNQQPPNPFPTGTGLSTYLGNKGYRLYQRFQASYEVNTGVIDPSSVHYLESYVVPGYTPIPCPGMGSAPYVSSQPHSDNDKAGTTAAGDLVYQIVEARLGSDGQMVNQFLNGPPGGDYTQVTPYIWSVIQFDVNGFTRSLSTSGNSGNVQIFPSYVLYSGPTQLFAVEEGNWQTFAQLNSNSYFRIQ